MEGNENPLICRERYIYAGEVPPVIPEFHSDFKDAEQPNRMWTTY